MCMCVFSHTTVIAFDEHALSASQWKRIRKYMFYVSGRYVLRCHLDRAALLPRRFCPFMSRAKDRCPTLQVNITHSLDGSCTVGKRLPGNYIWHTCRQLLKAEPDTSLTILEVCELCSGSFYHIVFSTLFIHWIITSALCTQSQQDEGVILT